MRHTAAIHDRRPWIGAGIALLVIILVLSIQLPPRLQVLAQPGAQAQSPTDSPLLNLSPADAARRAAIAKLGPINVPAGVNAAESYSRAMALYNQLTDADKNVLQNWRTKLDPQSAAALSAKLQPILRLLRDASDATYVDWGADPITPDARDARLSAMQSLSQVAQWEANHRFQTDSRANTSLCDERRYVQRRLIGAWSFCL